MTRYARALGSKASNARVSADPTPWTEMAPTRASMKRVAESIEDDDVTAPKKDKQTPAKKTPGKVVQMKNGTSPKSPMANATSPASTKKMAKKTPLKAKTPNGSEAPSTPKGIAVFCF